MISWITWGPLAFKQAQAENKPICLIVTQDGYWSRVLMKRALRDESLVSLLNQSYIAVRVDAEEFHK